MLIITLIQSAEAFKRARRSLQKHLCLIIDDSFSMEPHFMKVRQHCALFGKKFFEENGTKITLIRFGSEAEVVTCNNNLAFQQSLHTLTANSGGTEFAKPLRLLRDTIVKEKLKEVLVVFLTDGTNSDREQTKAATRELEAVLDTLYSKFHVIGCGS
jgi:Mg-chelatase subunit ChlD